VHVRACAAEYEPAVQAVQEVGAEDVAEENFPAAQAKHELIDVAPEATEYIPEEQSTHCDATAV